MAPPQFPGEKSTGVAYGCWALSFVGLAGINRFYLNKVGTGILWLFTLGLFGFGFLYDAFTIPNQVKQYNALHRMAHMPYGGHPNQNHNTNQITINMPGATAPVQQHAAAAPTAAWDGLPAASVLRTTCPKCSNGVSYSPDPSGRTRVTCPTCGASGMLTNPVASVQ